MNTWCEHLGRSRGSWGLWRPFDTLKTAYQKHVDVFTAPKKLKIKHKTVPKPSEHLGGILHALARHLGGHKGPLGGSGGQIGFDTRIFWPGTALIRYSHLMKLLIKGKYTFFDHILSR